MFYPKIYNYQYYLSFCRTQKLNWHLWRQNTAVLRAYKFYMPSIVLKSVCLKWRVDVSLRLKNNILIHNGTLQMFAWFTKSANRYYAFLDRNKRIFSVLLHQRFGGIVVNRAYPFFNRILPEIIQSLIKHF